MSSATRKKKKKQVQDDDGWIHVLGSAHRRPRLTSEGHPIENSKPRNVFYETVDECEHAGCPEQCPENHVRRVESYTLPQLAYEIHGQDEDMLQRMNDVVEWHTKDTDLLVSLEDLELSLSNIQASAKTSKDLLVLGGLLEHKVGIEVCTAIEKSVCFGLGSFITHSSAISNSPLKQLAIWLDLLKTRMQPT